MTNETKSNYPIWFQQFKDGDDDALLMLLEAERPMLFDYILLMTGQAERARSTVDEVGQVISADADRFVNAQELLAKLYVTSRNFCGDIWNGDVKELQNEALTDAEQVGSFCDSDHKLDKALKNTPGADREILCLSCRAMFSVAEMAKMFKVDGALVDKRLEETLKVLGEKAGIPTASVAAALAALPLHSILPDANHNTVALSEMMGKLDESKKGLSSWRRYFLICVLLGGGAYAAWKYLLPLLR